VTWFLTVLLIAAGGLSAVGTGYLAYRLFRTEP